MLGDLRIGTWNLEGRWSAIHAARLATQRCDVWLLTEVSHRMKMPGWVLHRSTLDMQVQRSYAAVAAPYLTREKDPHGASAAARVDGVYVCSSVLPWRASGQRPPWQGARHSDKTAAAIASLRSHMPHEPLVWGGDWNHALSGREAVGSLAGRGHIEGLLAEWHLVVPTADLPHRIDGLLSIDHLAVPAGWQATAERFDATGLSDHDGYVVEITTG